LGQINEDSLSNTCGTYAQLGAVQQKICRGGLVLGSGDSVGFWGDLGFARGFKLVLTAAHLGFREVASLEK